MHDNENSETSPPAQPFDLHARLVVLRAILDAKDTPSEMKHRVMVARQDGHLTDSETTQIIASWGLQEA